MDQQNQSESDETLSPTALLIRFGRNVQKCRIDQGISHKMLSEITGMELAHLTLIEIGQHNSTLEEVSTIAVALGVEAKILLS